MRNPTYVKIIELEIGMLIAYLLYVFFDKKGKKRQNAQVTLKYRKHFEKPASFYLIYLAIFLLVHIIATYINTNIYNAVFLGFNFTLVIFLIFNKKNIECMIDNYKLQKVIIRNSAIKRNNKRLSIQQNLQVSRDIVDHHKSNLKEITIRIDENDEKFDNFISNTEKTTENMDKENLNKPEIHDPYGIFNSQLDFFDNKHAPENNTQKTPLTHPITTENNTIDDDSFYDELEIHKKSEDFGELYKDISSILNDYIFDYFEMNIIDLDLSDLGLLDLIEKCNQYFEDYDHLLLPDFSESVSQLKLIDDFFNLHSYLNEDLYSVAVEYGVNIKRGITKSLELILQSKGGAII